MAAPVLRIPAALDQAALLQVVEHADELAPVEAERVRDRGLARARLLTDHREDAVLVHREARGLEFLDRPALDRVAEPPQQEDGAGKELLGENRRPALDLW